eukprot:TRINITY_DN57641_c0_g1_i1.p1 TRINITY_DN57641_c0_g1~~TRINITY_DN57641_c0_g1_i1.p1  ORF type:complete len:296 (-),score=31.62 TRINITY_DN57641_c0_g1_i1:122-1009(-)
MGLPFVCMVLALAMQAVALMSTGFHSTVGGLSPDQKVSAVDSARNQLPSVRNSIPGGSSLCWSIVKPGSYEVDILNFTYHEGGGLFECDEFLLVSNRSLRQDLERYNLSNLALSTSFIEGSLECAVVERWATCVDLFRKAWAAISRNAKFGNHDWIIKLDPDAVVRGKNLRQFLGATASAASTAAFISNWPKALGHLQGPLEILSRPAAGLVVQDGCHNSETWEDRWLERCLQQLSVQEIDGLGLGGFSTPLVNHPSTFFDIPSECSLQFIAIHPVKSLGKYEQCVHAKKASGLA